MTQKSPWTPHVLKNKLLPPLPSTHQKQKGSVQQLRWEKRRIVKRGLCYMFFGFLWTFFKSNDRKREERGNFTASCLLWCLSKSSYSFSLPLSLSGSHFFLCLFCLLIEYCVSLCFPIFQLCSTRAWWTCGNSGKLEIQELLFFFRLILITFWVLKILTLDSFLFFHNNIEFLI